MKPRPMPLTFPVRLAAVLCLGLLLGGLACAGEATTVPEVPEVPAAVRAAMEALPKDVRPLELRAARNGAVYALLPNGCELIVKEKRTAPVATVQAWVRTGAIHEGAALGAGLSHFCEHMLFKGTTKRPTGKLDQEIRGGGGDNNAYTSSERTVYHVTGVKEGFASAFAAVADMLMDSTFPSEETAKEHDVVCKEIERSLDDPQDAFWEAWERTIFQVHPYRVPVLGYPERFKAVTRDEVFGYYKNRYVPQLTTFIAVGDFDAAAVLPQMAKTLAPWPRTNAAPAPVPQEPPQAAPRRTEVAHPLCKMPKFILGYPTVALRHPDLYALDVLASILGDGRASRLYASVLDEEQLVHEIEAYNWTPMYPGYFFVMASADGKNLAKAQAAVLAVLEAAALEKPSQEQLDRAKRKVKAQHVFEQMTVDGVASGLGSDWLVAGDLDFSQTYVEGIAKVTADDVLRVARQYFDPQKLNVTVLKSGAAEDAPHPPGQKAMPTDKPPAAEPVLHKELAVHEVKLDNGLRVVVRPDPSLPAVHAALAGLGGQRWEPEALPGAGKFLAGMLDRGTEKRGKEKLAADVENLGASLAPFGGRNAIGVQVRCLKEDFPALLEAAADCLLHPKFAPEEIEKLRTETLAAIEEEDESLWTLNDKVLRPLLYGTHPYARRTLGTKESVGKIGAADLRKLHAAWARPDNLALAVTGDVDPKAVAEQVLAIFKDLKAPAGTLPPAPAMPPPGGRKEGDRSEENIEGALMQLAFRGVPLTDPDRDALDFIAATLSSLGGRLLVALREEEGLTYSAGVYNDAQVDGGAIVFYAQTDSEKLPRCLEKTWAEIEKLRTQPVPDDELERVKSYLVGTFATGLQDQEDVALRMALAQLYGEDLNAVFHRDARFRALTAQQIQAAAVKYLNPDRAVKAVVRPIKR